MSEPAELRSGVRSRTRRAILGAAASVLARDRAATLADIADAADVGRSTLHRYFTDRQELIDAVVDDSLEALGQAVEEAALDQGTASEAIHRLIAAMVQAGDRLLFLYGDPRVLADRGETTSSSQPLIQLIERGQAEGVFDPELSAAWIEHVLWALVYTGAEVAHQGKLPRPGITETVIRTLEHGIHARQPPRP
jgi:AcrR family transcriptional regulator